MALPLRLTLLSALIPTALGVLTLALALALPLGVALGMLLLERAKLADELRDLILLLVELGAELVVQLLEFTGQRRGGPVTGPPALGLRSGLIPGGAVSRVAGPAAGHALVLHPGAGLGQRCGHLDPQVDQLVQLLLHLVQLVPALLEVPAHSLLVVLQGAVDFLGELASLPSLTVLGRLTLGRSPPLLGQGREDERRQRQEQACKHTIPHLRSPSLKMLKWDVDRRSRALAQGATWRRVGVQQN
jgi:hypothetical protein